MQRHRPIVKAPGSQPMYIVVGLPIAVHRNVLTSLERQFPDAIFKGIPASAQDGALYPASFLDGLIRSVGEFVVRRRTNGNAQPTPASISLLFVPAHDQETLLRCFDFLVMATPLHPLAERDERGRQLRHDLQVAENVLRDALAPSSPTRMGLNEVKRRLGYLSDNEELLLPPGNFMTQEGDLTSLFRALRSDGGLWSDRLENISPTPLTHDDVPSRISPKQTRRPFVDSRGMAFFIAHPNAYDGAVREVETAEMVKDVLSSLRSLYRFGGVLPQGIHHDAQRSDGSSLGGATFHCSEKGRIRSSSKYANIYPNDFVRVEHFEEE